MLNYKVKIGLVPLRRDCTARHGTFNWEFAEARGREIVKYIEEHYTTENVSFVDLKGVIDVETLWSTKDVDKVVKHFNDTFQINMCIQTFISRGIAFFIFCNCLISLVNITEPLFKCFWTDCCMLWLPITRDWKK